MRYEMIALDLDGTLLDPTGHVSDENVAAVARAREAGALAVICTGRGLIECRHVVERIGGNDPVVAAGGAMVADPATGATLHRFPINLALAERAVGTLLAHGHPALVFKDSDAAGFDYLVVSPDGPAKLDRMTRWWFDTMNVRVRVVASLAEDEHPEHTVRVGVCAAAGDVAVVERELRGSLGDAAQIHTFPAVSPEQMPGSAGYQRAAVVILEMFDRLATKWTALEWLARSRGIDPRRVMAIGDQINDLAMIEGAGLGVAMGNAIPVIKAKAGRVTLDNANHGVAHAIERVLRGEW